MIVVKRDGQEVEFKSNLIFDAVYKAAQSTGYRDYDAHGIADQTTTKVVSKLPKKCKLEVEEIQDVVQHVLMVSKYKDVAEEYIGYRRERDIKREEKSSWAAIGIDITTGADTESQRENSNVPRDSVTTQIEMVKRLYAKKFANDFLIPEDFKNAHNAGEIHIHDAENLITKIPNCGLMHYPFMLENGFQLGNKWIEEPTTILTTMNVLVQMVQVQSNLQFGGLTLQDLDVHLGKYILGSYRKYLIDAIIDLQDVEESCAGEQLKYFENVHPEDIRIKEHLYRENEIAIRKTERETYRAAKLLSYQLNTLQVRGESSPFVTITYGHATSWEGRLLQKCILQERQDEFDRSGVQEFPKHMFNVKQGLNLNREDPNYDIFLMAMKTSAKTCYPDYIFPDNQDYHTGGNAGYMGCRSLLAPWYNDKGEKQYLGRANAGVCSVNLPRIAMECKGDKEKFFELLKERLDLAAKVVKWRYDRLITLKAKEAAFTYIGGVFGMHLDPEETIEKVFADGRGSLSIGYIGCYETSLIMTKEDPVYSDKAFDFQMEVMKFINEQVLQYKKLYHKGFSLYSSPSESLTDRFCRLDKEKFGSVEGVTDKGFYVNSFHVNTEAAVTPFEKMAFESQFQPLTTGGHVSFVEMNNLSDNLDAYETIVRYAHDKKMMYIGINSPWSFCKTCHWTGDLELQEDVGYKYCCPECGESDPDKIVLTVRLCGYLSTANKRPPVAGRVKEIQSRVKHG